MFETVLVANRGEIAVRVIRTIHRLGARAVAVYSDADTKARHVREADDAVRIGPPPAAESYLNVAAIIDAARDTGAEAIHPGYGFLSENPEFARTCAEAGVVFVGPPPEAIEMMGDKIRSKALARDLGVPVVPGRDAPGLSDEDLAQAALAVGYPVLIKPSAGGGGKGMRIVDDETELAEALAGARREAQASFGDDTLFLERYIERPRHIEVQVFADAFGNVIHLGARECSLQRRHQKIIEETPSVVIDAERLTSIAKDALTVTKGCGYVGAVTVEFIVPAESPSQHFFLEMNTRLQVEHPVTEFVTGIDLVEWQLEVAAGEPLRFNQKEVAAAGHSIEARIYAEDPWREFLPTGGRVLLYEEPQEEMIRVDSGVDVGTDVSSLYDPMLAKVVAWGVNREEAIDRLKGALSKTVIVGVRTNIDFLSHLLSDPDVRAGALDTGLAERALARFDEPRVDENTVAAAALGLACELEPSGDRIDLWDVPDGWRMLGRAWTSRVLEFEHAFRFTVRWRGRPADVEIQVDDGPIRMASASLSSDVLVVATETDEVRYRFVADGQDRWIARGTESWRVRTVTDLGREAKGQGPIDLVVRSPMPGSVVAVAVAAGQHVEAGEVLVVVEAMKMEHSVTATVAGNVVSLRVGPGDRVTMDEELAVIEAPREDAISEPAEVPNQTRSQ